MPAFHEVLFPLDIALKSAGGPERKTEIVAVGSGREERNARWAHSRRRYDAGYGVKTMAALTPLDQAIGTGNGATTTFQLVKTYGSIYAPYARPIGKPVANSVRVAVAGTEVTAGTAFTCDATTGVVTFLTGHVPATGAAVTAGFLFDVPVRFDTDYLEVDLSAFAAGAIPKIPLVEIKP